MYVSVCCLCLGSSEGVARYSLPFHIKMHQCIIENCQCVCVTLTGRNSDASWDADTVVNDSKHVDVVLHSCLQARDGAGGHIAWNPNL